MGEWVVKGKKISVRISLEVVGVKAKDHIKRHFTQISHFQQIQQNFSDC
jgi:hypothetical protein